MIHPFHVASSLRAVLSPLRACALSLFVISCGARPDAAPSEPVASLRIPVAPQLADLEAERALVFEVLVENPGTAPIFVEGVELEAGPFAWSAGPDVCAVVLRYPDVDAERLASLAELRGPMEADAALGPCSVPPGRAVFVPLWGSAPPGTPAPEQATVTVRLRHGGEHAVETISAPVREEAPLVLGPPLRGGSWLVLNGLAADAGHRAMALRMRGAPHWAQRFAADLAGLDEAGCALAEGASFRENDRYVAYGTEVIAVADGRISRVLDGVPENVPGERAVPITVETVTGNAVWLDLGDDRHAFYAHLIPGSITVAEGDLVHRGDVLGRLGNSGNSTNPHLHFHVARGLGGLDTEGIPYVLERFSARSVATPESLFGGSRCLPLADDERPLERLLPSRHSVIRFDAP